ncbi:ATP-binding protein [Halorussus salinisoli]|uniref:ATP-binding protein n=1 Tax=Halorussus salinisoli TaxID=2558242 RepID=UPI0010C1E3B5|nr:ATP-binding protein [Halorussus salinisoli]
MAPTDDAFYREAKSQIRALNDGLLAVENDADEGVAVAELFRVAHSLKGSCRTHGLDEAGELAHAIEDALDAIRGGEVEPTSALIDEALGTVDLLEATVRADAIGGEVEGDPEAARASLRATLDEVRARPPTDSDGTLGASESGLDDSGDEWDPADDDLSDDVVAVLEDTAEFDDIDSLLDGMDAPDADEELDGWGMLGDEDAVGDGTDAADDAAPANDVSADSPQSSGEPNSAETPDEPSAFFEETKEQIADDSNIDALQEDIDAVEFGEFDDEDNFTIEELMDLEPDESPDEGPAATSPEERSPAEGGTPTGEMSPPEDRPPSPTADSDASPAGSDDPLDLSADLLGSGTSEPSATDDSTSGNSADATDPVGDPLGLADDDLSPDDATPSDPDPGESVAGSDATTDEAGENGTEADGTGTFVFGNDGADDAPDAESGGEAVSPEESKSESTRDEARGPADADTPEPADADASAGTPDAATESESVPDDGSTPDADSVPDAGSVLDADSMPDDVSELGALSETESNSDSALDADSVPDADLGVDLSGEFDADLGGATDDAGNAGDVGMDVSVDEEMAEFESRFGDLLGTGPGADDAGDEGAVFRSAVATIEKSSLDADEFPTGGRADRSEATGEFDRLQSMTVDVDTADRLLNVAEELSLSHLRLDEAVGPETDDAIREEVSNLLRVVTEYRRTVMDVRLMPLETAIDAIPRTVRDVARSQGKEVELVVNDADVELDRSIVDRLRDPLVHLARNAVDHGIESPDEREAVGKAAEGTVAISAERVGDEVVIELSDDGRGVDPEAVREQAVENGVVAPAEAEAMTDDETYDLLFEPGFTTTEEVTDVSGRGVGMDVVNRTIADLNGTVTVESDPGVGTTVRLTVPVSIALTEVLFVEVAGQTFGIPMTAVEQITAAPPVESTEDGEVVRRSNLDLVGGLPEDVEADDAYPFVRLESALGLDEPGESGVSAGRGGEVRAGKVHDGEARDGETDDSQIVWIRTQTGRLAVRCDRVVASQEVVVRPYGDLLRDVPGVSGATTLGDGQAVNVLDVATL